MKPHAIWAILPCIFLCVSSWAQPTTATAPEDRVGAKAASKTDSTKPPKIDSTKPSRTSKESTPQKKVLTLEQALELARRRNERVLIAKEQLVQARLVRDRAWARFLPTLAGYGTMVRADREIKVQDRMIQRKHSFSGQLSATLTLFSGTSIPGLLRSYKEAGAAKQDTRWTLNTLSFEVAQAYFSAVAARNLLSAAIRTQKSAEEQLMAALLRRKVGQDTRVDELRARFRVVSAKGDLIRARNVLQNSLDYLAFMVGRKEAVQVGAAVDIRIPEDVEKEQEKDAVSRRPDYRSADIMVEAARKAIVESWMDYLPSLTLTGTYDFTQNTGWSGRHDSWKIIISLQWTLFDGGLRRATRIEKDSKLKELRARKKLLDRTISMQLRQARRDLATARASFLVAANKLDLARKNREMLMGRYRAGLANYLDLISVEDELKQAEVEHVAEELNLATKKLLLLKELGYDPLGKKIP